MKEVSTSNAPKAIGPYSQAIIVDQFVYTSGQIPLNQAGELVSGGIIEQTHQVFKNLQAVLKEAGSSLNQVVKTTVFLSDMENFHPMNEVYSQYFGSHKPARSCVEVSRLPKDVLVEIEIIAMRELEEAVQKVKN